MSKQQEKFAETMRGLAEAIDFAVNGPNGPKAVGFAVMLFDFGDTPGGRMNWISNADRKDMIVALKEMVAQLEGRRMTQEGQA